MPTTAYSRATEREEGHQTRDDLSELHWKQWLGRSTTTTKQYKANNSHEWHDSI